MLTTLSTEDYYDALIRRDPAYEGFVYACVRSTGIFCRLTCPARKPLKENCTFRQTIGECIAAGFRPCLRCKPMTGLKSREPVVVRLMDALEAKPDRRFRQEDILAMGLDLSTVRRAFKRQFGMSFLEIARQRRVGMVAEKLVQGADVIGAQIDAGFESGSGFRAAVNQSIGDAPQRLRGKTLLKADWIETAIGPMLAITCEHALHLLEFAERQILPNEIKRLRERNNCGIVMGRTAVTDQVERELTDYFAGRSGNFAVRLAEQGTPFEQLVWEGLRVIPVGLRITYSQLAERIGRPAAVRAAGRANGANPIAIVVPCHRVVGSDGSLTGYGGLPWRKQWLLEHERRMANAINHPIPISGEETL